MEIKFPVELIIVENRNFQIIQIRILLSFSKKGEDLAKIILLLIVNNIVIFNYPSPDTIKDIESFDYEDFKI